MRQVSRKNNSANIKLYVQECRILSAAKLLDGTIVDLWQIVWSQSCCKRIVK